MHDMVTIDTIVFEIVRGGGEVSKPPLIVNLLKRTGSDSVNSRIISCLHGSYPNCVIVIAYHCKIHSQLKITFLTFYMTF